MILIDNFSQVTAQIESERGIDRQQIASAIEKALISAARKKYSNELDVKSTIDQDSGEVRLWIEKEVVSKHSEENKENELLVSEAKELDDNAEQEGTDKLEDIEADSQIERLIPSDISANEKIVKINDLLKKKKRGSLHISKELKRRLQNRRSALKSRLRKTQLISKMQEHGTGLSSQLQMRKDRIEQLEIQVESKEEKN